MKTSLTEPLLKKISWRLLPFLLLMYILAFLDRANVGFAKQAFQADTGVSDAAFAFGAGVFFVGYALLEVPSNLLLHRLGARLWMCRIMVTWGLISAAMAFAYNETSFYVLRFLLGVAEAGFFPGVILYLTYWFPSARRAKAMGFFYFGAPLAFIFGSPLSGLLLELDGFADVRGWQWMFIVEGLLATAVGVWAYWYLDNHPADAKWLSASEREQVQDVLDQENRHKQQSSHNLLRLLSQPTVLYLCLIYLMIQVSVYGVIFYLPAQVSGLLGVKIGWQVGLVSAVPWVCAVLAAYWLPGYSDRTGERRKIGFLTLLVSAAGIACSVTFSNPLLGLIALCFAASGFISVQPIFWTFPSTYLAGGAAAAGIGLINSCGAMGGFIAPVIKNWADTTWQSSAAGLYLISITTVVVGLMFLGVWTPRQPVEPRVPTTV